MDLGLAGARALVLGSSSGLGRAVAVRWPPRARRSRSSAAIRSAPAAAAGPSAPRLRWPAT